MPRLVLSALALLMLGFTSQAFGQTREELLKENEELKARLQALEAKLAAQAEDEKNKAVVVGYDPATQRLVLKAGAKERTVQLEAKTHVHDVDGAHVELANRADKLRPGVEVTVVEEDGQVFSVNLGGGKHGHDHDRQDQDRKCEWRYHDPVKPGWWKPSDDYRPYSWLPPPSEGFFKDLFCGRFVETHRSPSGTPWVHPFTIEPPQLHRDLFFIYKYAKDAEGGPTDEHEAELHIDWALTRRFGILVAAPYLGLIGPDEQATGFGDVEIAPRIVFVESDKFYLSTNLLLTLPTGDEERGLGVGETVFAPFLTTWNDLGGCRLPWKNWNTAYCNFGPEIGLETGETSLLYTVVLAHTFVGPKLIFPHQHTNGNGHQHNGNGNGHQHNGNGHNGHGAAGGTISHFGPAYPVGLTSLLLEFNGQTALRGEDSTLLQLLTGFAYSMTESGEFRFGVNFPLNRPSQQFDVQYFLAFSYLF